MRFLFVSNNEVHGASEALWTQTVVELKGRGHEVMALAPWLPLQRGNQSLDYLNAAEIPYKTLARSPLGVVLPKVTSRRFWSRTLRQVTSRFKPDLLVLSNGPWNDCLPLLPGLNAVEVPFVTLDHGIAEISWPNGKEIEIIASTYIKAASNYFVSESSRYLASVQLGVDLPYSKVVRNPFMVDYDARPPWPENDGMFRAACVARYHPRTKGQDILIEIMSLPKWSGRRQRVHCFGGGPGGLAIEREIKRRSLDNLSLHGFTKDIEAIWKDHHLLVMPSRSENMPLALVEAMLCGRPAVVTDVGGNKELIEHGVNGFVAESATVGSFERTLEEAWQARSRWREMGEAAARKIRKLIPRHPEKVFADELEMVATHPRERTLSAYKEASRA
jgi:glycosyltransferase involved in cell wall biosynthesis